jgi:hypothetical protein
MRIAGGVVLLVCALLLLLRGCTTYGGAAAGEGLMKMTKGLADSAKKAAKDTGVETSEMDKAMAQAQSLVKYGKIVGIVILLAGLLCIPGGIMFFVNKAKPLAFVAAGLGIVGEVLMMILVGFGAFGLVTIAGCGFALFAATKIGADAAG